VIHIQPDREQFFMHESFIFCISEGRLTRVLRRKEKSTHTHKQTQTQTHTHKQTTHPNEQMANNSYVSEKRALGWFTANTPSYVPTFIRRGGIILIGDIVLGIGR
jgi:hypothetical protein